MEKLSFITLLLPLITINIAGAEKPDSPRSVDRTKSDVTIQITPQPTLAIDMLCRNLQSNEDFTRLITAMTDKVMQNLRSKLTARQFRDLDRDSIADQLRHDLKKMATEKAAAHLSTSS